MNEQDIVDLIRKDPWMMKILREVRSLNLPDWWIGAGFVRSKVWDTLHGYTVKTPLPDIDVIYLDQNDFTPAEMRAETTKAEEKYEKLLLKTLPKINWSVTNQARMHIFHKDKPYLSSAQALARWVETATCVGVKLDSHDHVILTTPHGISDLVQLIVRPSPAYAKKLAVFHQRYQKKQWLSKWPKLKIVTSKV